MTYYVLWRKYFFLKETLEASEKPCNGKKYNCAYY